MPSKLTCKLPVPPLTKSVTEPVGLLQSLFCCEATEILRGPVGCVKVTLSVPEQPKSSVAVIVYVPAAKPVKSPSVFGGPKPPPEILNL